MTKQEKTDNGRLVGTIPVLGTTVDDNDGCRDSRRRSTFDFEKQVKEKLKTEKGN